LTLIHIYFFGDTVDKAVVFSSAKRGRENRNIVIFEVATVEEIPHGNYHGSIPHC
jgi:hypothetical protein